RLCTPRSLPLSLVHPPLPPLLPSSSLFFFNDTATTEIYTLSLHDALPISKRRPPRKSPWKPGVPGCVSVRNSTMGVKVTSPLTRSEEHTSELQSLTNLVCRLLLEKKKKKDKHTLTALTVRARRCLRARYTD